MLSVPIEPEAVSPAPSAEMELIETFVEAYVETAHVKPRVRARAFLEAAARNLSRKASVAAIVPIRAGTGRAAQAQALGDAVAAFDRLRPTLLAKLPPDDMG